MRLRTLKASDAERITELNAASYPAVPLSTLAEIVELIELSDYSFAAVDDIGMIVAFVIGMRPGADYTSENYRFFEGRGSDSLYVDRIVVAHTARGIGLGQVLYGAVFDLARAEGRTEVTCEVNLDPPNPGSLRFHHRLGFMSVGEQATKGGTVTVSLLAADVRS